VAHANSRADCAGLADLTDRSPHALALPSLNGLSFALSPSPPVLLPARPAAAPPSRSCSKPRLQASPLPRRTRSGALRPCRPRRRADRAVTRNMTTLAAKRDVGAQHHQQDRREGCDRERRHHGPDEGHCAGDGCRPRRAAPRSAARPRWSETWCRGRRDSQQRGRGQRHRSRCIDHIIQSATISPGTRANSRPLAVTRVALRRRACAAMR